MPFTIHGIGTHYYGRRNSFLRSGLCSQCKRQAQLESYDTGHFLVVFYVPVLPLGRRQVLDSCPSCSAHHVMPLQKYLTAREVAIEEATAALAREPEEAAPALALLQTLSAYNQLEEARELAAAAEAQHRDSAEVQFYLAAWQDEVGMDAARSTACLERAWELEPENPVYRRAMAWTLATRLQLDEASQLAVDFHPESEFFDPSLLVHLGQAAQSLSQHTRALGYFRMANHDGGLDYNPEFRRAVETSERETGAPASMLKPKKGWKRMFGQNS